MSGLLAEAEIHYNDELTILQIHADGLLHQMEQSEINDKSILVKVRRDIISAD